MAMNDRVIDENAAQTQRLEAVARDIDRLSIDIGGGWTVSTTLAHLAFWDRRAVLLISRFTESRENPDVVDDDLLNDALLPEWLELAPARAAGMAVEAANEMDASVRNFTES